MAVERSDYKKAMADAWRTVIKRSIDLIPVSPDAVPKEGSIDRSVKEQAVSDCDRIADEYEKKSP